MARPLRLEYPGAIYHITSRGNNHKDIYLKPSDRNIFLSIFGKVCRHYNWCCYAYCLMSNHYHLVLETAEANLSRGMQQLNSVYSQRFNRRHKRIGHVFQGRYKSIHVDKDSYLLEVIRYVLLNPVRAYICKSAGQYTWSSYREMIGKRVAPDWLNLDWALSQYGNQVSTARKRFIEYVGNGSCDIEIWSNLRHQIYMGDVAFIEKVHRESGIDYDLIEVPRVQKRKARKGLEYYFDKYEERNSAIIEAFVDGGYTQKELSEFCGLHYSSISKILKRDNR